MITFICGELCTGKSYHSAFYSHLGLPVIEVSEIVKRNLKLSKALDPSKREYLQGHKDMDEMIIADILQCYESMTDVIVVGLRQKSVLERIVEHKISHTVLWISTPIEVRKERYSKDIKNSGQSFDTATLRDDDLGILELKKFIYEKY